MKPELGPPDVEEIDYPAEDVSWAREWEHFRSAIAAGDGASCSATSRRPLRVVLSSRPPTSSQ